MNKKSIELKLPVGRMVQGSLYKFNSTDAENRPLIWKTGKLTGQPRVEYFFRLAIMKGSEKHWNETAWGSQIWNLGQLCFPAGAANSPVFAWKIIDGDNTTPNREGTRPCDQEGFAGHWVLKITSAFAPVIYNADGSARLLEENAVNLGDYIEVFCRIDGNGSAQQPGIYFNTAAIALAGYGVRISNGFNAKTVGFGQTPLPPGASKIPVSQGFTPPKPAVAPYPQILEPSVPTAPAAPVHQMTPKANGISYEQYISNGWTDAQLIQHGMML